MVSVSLRGAAPAGRSTSSRTTSTPISAAAIRCRSQTSTRTASPTSLPTRSPSRSSRGTRTRHGRATSIVAGDAADRQPGDGRHRRRRHSRDRVPELVRDAGRPTAPGSNWIAHAQRRSAPAVEGREDRSVPDLASRRVGRSRRRRQEGTDQRAADRREEPRADLRSGQGVGVLVQPEGLEAARRSPPTFPASSTACAR